MPLIQTRPNLPPLKTYMVKEAAKELGIDKKIFYRFKAKGFIEPLNPGSTRPRYTGESIMLCWDMAVKE